MIAPLLHLVFAECTSQACLGFTAIPTPTGSLVTCCLLELAIRCVVPNGPVVVSYPQVCPVPYSTLPMVRGACPDLLALNFSSLSLDCGSLREALSVKGCHCLKLPCGGALLEISVSDSCRGRACCAATLCTQEPYVVRSVALALYCYLFLQPPAFLQDLLVEPSCHSMSLPGGVPRVLIFILHFR